MSPTVQQIVLKGFADATLICFVYVFLIFILYIIPRIPAEHAMLLLS